MSLGKKIRIGFDGFGRINRFITRGAGQRNDSKLPSRNDALKHGLDGLGSAGSKSFRALAAIGAGVSGLLSFATIAYSDEAEHGLECPSYPWPHEGILSSYDQASIRRGHQVYQQVCVSCHSMSLISYRDLVGVAYTEEEIKTMAAEIEVVDGPNDECEMFTRPGKLSDRFPQPYANEAAARFANGGAYPPDPSLITKTMYSSEGWDSYSWGFLAEADEIDGVIHNPAGDKDPACGPLIDFVALKALKTPKRPTGNMLKNGNFEEGPYIFPNTTWGVLIPPNIEDDHSPLLRWMIESLKAVKYIDAEHFHVPEGKRAVELVAGRESAIPQVVRTRPGKIYDLLFSIGDASNSCEGSMLVEAFAGKITMQFPYESKGKGGFKRARLKFTAISPRTRVRILSTYYHMKSDNSGSLCGPVVDDVRLAGVRNPHLP